MVTLESAARIIIRQESGMEKAPAVKGREADLFDDTELFGPKKGVYFKKARNRILSDIDELIRENRWGDVIDLYHPVEDKAPDLAASGEDLAVREKIAFALGQVKRFDEAIDQLKACIQAVPDNFYTRSSLAYTAYNSLFAAKNKEIFLAGESRTARIKLAHDNFRQAQELRPDGVTNFYRQGMLYAQIENKPKPALPLFNRACRNWESLDEKEQARRHQEKKNYVKSLYRSASLLLSAGNGREALERIKRCLEQDEQSNHINLGFKYFALGKVQFHLDNYPEAKNALLFALQSSGKGRPVDFVHELLARTYLALEKTDKALETINAVPEKLRRSYYRWTEADVLCVAGQYDRAKAVLLADADRDSRTRHISLVRLAKIDYTLKNYAEAGRHAEKAVSFFRKKWGNAYYEGIFWQALNCFKAGETSRAGQLVEEIETECPRYPGLSRLRQLISGQQP